VEQEFKGKGHIITQSTYFCPFVNVCRPAL